MPLDPHRAANRANWDDRVPIHAGSREYDVEGFIAGRRQVSTVVAYDAPYVGDVAGKTLLHLQCHFGLDTLSWARLGAEVTGVDFSEPALAEARRIAAAAGIDARFVLSELYDSPNAIDRRFDVVYTGVGAVNWLPDIAGWARVVAHFLRPGGMFYIREGHPAMWTLDWEVPNRLEVAFPYFETAEPVAWDEDVTYAGTGTVEHGQTYAWNHGIGEIFTALRAAGLTIDALVEHREVEWSGHPLIRQDDDGWFRLPPEQRDLLPLMYSLTAFKPEE